jgi:acetyl esterase/lipase
MFLRRFLTLLGASALIGAAFMTMPAESGAAPPYTTAPVGVTIERDVPFLAPDRAEKLDMYLPATRSPGAKAPGIVIIHGGGWTGGSKSAGREFNIGTTLAKAGYVCASIDYRLEKTNRWPTNVRDCKNAVRFLRKNAAKYGIDTEHIGVIGGSAGGHLALMVGVTSKVNALEPPAPYPGVSDTVQAVVDMYGIADVSTGKKTDAQGNPTGEHKSWDSVFGDQAPITDADRTLASPTTYLTAEIPPILILHGTADTTVDRDQSIDLAKRLTEFKREHQLILVPGIGHTFDLQTWNGKPLPTDLRPVVTAFFDKHLKPAAGGS